MEHAPHDSAVNRATDSDWWITGEVQMLVEVEHGLRVLAWQKSKDATRPTPQHYPERLPITKADRDAQKASRVTEYDVAPVAEMDDFLGWDRYRGTA